MEESKLLQFAPFSSAVDAGFWYQLTKKKLEIFKLEDNPVEICSFYSNSSSTGLPPIVNFDYSAFDKELSLPSGNFCLRGTLINTNTLEDFKQRDKRAVLQTIGKKIWESIKDKSALENPESLQHILCLTFADIKKYHYYYWVGFPALTYPEVKIKNEIEKFYDYFTPNQVTQLLDSYDSLDSSNKTAFLIFKSAESCYTSSLKTYEELKNKNGQILLGFADPSTYNNYPGWPLRNLLSLASYHWSKDKTEWDILCFREYVKEGKRHTGNSIVVSVQLESTSVNDDCPDVVGWEKNKNKLAPRKVDMSANMDPLKLADSAVDLNLKLMRWRLSPELQLQTIKSSNCLLFGAGTLGCNVARCLMGWGVRKITLVDNSRISFSNPVRQTLFTFNDCLQGGQQKATAAAKALKDIFPGVDAEGKVINVPMPGHTISENLVEQTKLDILEIERLISSHDVIFLLMDTRESRWLPTLIAASKSKIVINAALGFDTFLVMRHGQKLTDEISSCEDEASKIINGSNLGCYFCNDIVAPGNSLQDRTLDQQCTVTRPGVSYMAAALAVELMVSVLQHPKQGLASASIIGNSDYPPPELCTELGLVPHQIRGYLDRFQNVLLTSKSFDRCTACSNKVIEKYKADGVDFLLKVFNDSNYLEEVTGLTELMTTISMDEVLELSDDDSV